MYLIKSELYDYGIQLPVELSEITGEMLADMVKDVNVSKYYSIVAVCLKVKLFDLVSTINSPSDYKKDATIRTTCLMAKTNPGDSGSLECSTGDRVIVDRSSLERASHLYLSYNCGYEKVCKYIGADKDLLKKLMWSVKQNVVLIEFKIVPNADIRASLPKGMNADKDPFVVKG